MRPALARIGILVALAAIIAPQAATADTSVDLSQSVWNTTGWTPLDPTDLSTTASCASQTPWKVSITAVMESDGRQYEHIALLKPNTKCAERFYGEQVSIVDQGLGGGLVTYSTSGSYTATQYVNYGEIPPIEVRTATPADPAVGMRASAVTFEAKTMNHQNHWTCMYSTWTAVTGTQPKEINVRTANGDGVTGC
ncbi:MAG: hypothetical protein QOD07_1233 [Frankiaceae bacterium]|nr:hypothetical protein [Frankiaceae bacterium]